MYKVLEVDCSTGISSEREMTAEEISQWEAKKQEQEEKMINFFAETEKIATDKESAFRKLSALGLTTDEIAALTK